MAIDVQWRPDFGSAAVFRDGVFAGLLGVEPWWTEARGEPEQAWVFGHLDPASGEFEQFCVEVPATAVDAGRRDEIEELLAAAIAAGPQRPAGPVSAPAATSLSSAEISQQLDRVIAAWAVALDELRRVAERRDPDPIYTLYLHLVHVLNWAYTGDQALQAAWNRVPAELKVRASKQTDGEVERALAERQGRGTGEPSLRADPIFGPYFERQRRRRPYENWADVLLAGGFHAEFFDGLKWVSGKMRHGAVELTIELRQMRAGGEPRWKWKPAAAVAPIGRNDKRGPEMYEKHLAEQDVLGRFSWLVDIYADARRLLVGLLSEAEVAAASDAPPGGAGAARGS